jgi:nucleotide-binding universal stress UspA family protein
MLRRLLVPLDGSPFAASVIPLALDLARRSAGEIRFVVVTPPMPASYGAAPPTDPAFELARRADNRRYLDEVLERESGKGVTVSGELLEGPVADSLVDAAQSHRSDLIILATHGRGGFSRFWLGSTATALIRQSPVPVLLLRPGEGEDLRPLAPRRVLLPVDGSGFGEEIIWDALELGGTHGVSYHVVQVIAKVPVALDYGSPEQERRNLAAREAAALEYLGSVRQGLVARGAAVITQVLVSDSPARAIIDYAESNRCGLIAMATHGRGGVGRLVIGSVADKVLRACRVPLLLRGPAV